MLNVVIYRQYTQDGGIKRETKLLLFKIIIAAAVAPKTPQISTGTSATTRSITEKQQSNIQVKLQSHIFFIQSQNLRLWLISHSFLIHNPSIPVTQHSSVIIKIQCQGSRIQLGLLQLQSTVPRTATPVAFIVAAMTRLSRPKHSMLYKFFP